MKIFAEAPERYAFFAHSSRRAEIAATISAAVQRLNGYTKRKESSRQTGSFR